MGQYMMQYTRQYMTGPSSPRWYTLKVSLLIGAVHHAVHEAVQDGPFAAKEVHVEGAPVDWGST